MLIVLCLGSGVVWTEAVPVDDGTLRELSRHAVGVPSYDRARLIGRIAHIGVGGFHRAHLARYVDELAAAGSTWGIIGLGLLPQDEAMAAALGAQDHMYTLIERGPGEPTVAVIGSIVDYQLASDDPARAVEVLAQPDVAIISLTITEAGYVEGAATFDVLAQALAVRHARGLGPVTLMSCDNVPGNGDATRRATLAAVVAHGAGPRRVGRDRVHVPQLDGRSHHPRHDRRRSCVAPRRATASTIGGRSSPSRSANGWSRTPSPPVDHAGRTPAC